MNLKKLEEAHQTLIDADRYRYLRDNGHLDRFVELYEQSNDLDELNELEQDGAEYRDRCDEAIDEMINKSL